ncbi:hypothetical protein [Gilvibacter sp.]|uniref:hypothetical protein n=1 Tax=Gilvibacter sp. TaxID=2729997 RepID=UPI0025B92F55|nr:hypothetical protein [Gilvibacter sp.]NQX78522.1 hypothetical protein [Gilvibacter sp.]
MIIISFWQLKIALLCLKLTIMTEQLYQSLSWIPEYATGVWVTLSAILVFTLLRVGKRQQVGSALFNLGIGVLALIWLYPLITPYFYPIETGLILTLITFGFSIYYYSRLAREVAKLHLLLVPQLIWLSLSTLYLLLVLISKFKA